MQGKAFDCALELLLMDKDKVRVRYTGLVLMLLFSFPAFHDVLHEPGPLQHCPQEGRHHQLCLEQPLLLRQLIVILLQQFQLWGQQIREQQ